jgi:phosphoribosylglycinamide formyltransferase-1
MKARIAVLVSGGGTNLQALLDARDSGALRSGEIALVVSSRADAFALKRAQSAGIEALTVTKSDGEPALAAALDARGIDLIVLAGYLTILSADFVGRYKDRIVNVHPSLIPAFCGKGYYGLTPHREALRRAVKLTGATVHLVNEIPDGGRILAQKAVEVEPGDTPETLQRRVMERAEWVLLPRAVEALCAEMIKERANEPS